MIFFVIDTGNKIKFLHVKFSDANGNFPFIWRSYRCMTELKHYTLFLTVCIISGSVVGFTLTLECSIEHPPAVLFFSAGALAGLHAVL